MVDASVALRAGGGAAILVGGTLGVALPFLLGRLRDGAPWLLYTKAAAAGIILALAVVHLINHCFHEFAELTPGALCRRLHVTPRSPLPAAPGRTLPAFARWVSEIARRAANERRGGAHSALIRRCASGVDTLWRAHSPLIRRSFGAHSALRASSVDTLAAAALAAAVAGALMRRAPASQARCTLISP